MNTVVAYDSAYGNTEKVARAMARRLQALGPVEVRAVGGAFQRLGGRVDLLLIGGPTQGYGMSPEMRAFTETFTADALAGARVAVFDTRFRMPAFLTGSAARRIASRLRRQGILPVTPPESFFVTRTAKPQLEPGELERAEAWAEALKSCVLPV
jgi:flavodoxin